MDSCFVWFCFTKICFALQGLPEYGWVGLGENVKIVIASISAEVRYLICHAMKFDRFMCNLTNDISCWYWTMEFFLRTGETTFEFYSHETTKLETDFDPLWHYFVDLHLIIHRQEKEKNSEPIIFISNSIFIPYTKPIFFWLSLTV